MRYILSLLAMALILGSCSRNKNVASIEGEIEGLKPDTTSIILFGYDINYEQIDSIETLNGKFSHKVTVDTLTVMTLRLNSAISYPLFVDKGDKIKIEGKIEGEKVTLNVEGNALNEELSAVMNTLNNPDSLKRVPLTKRVKSYIAQHSSSPVSAYLLTRYLAYNGEMNPDQLDSIVGKLAGSLSDNIMISTLNEQLKVAKRASEDKYAPLFNVKNLKGETVNRNKNFKDKYMLLTFWASWDRGSRINNAALRRLNKKMKKNEKEFGMLGIALDMDLEEWRKACESDSLTWEQGCETSMFNADVVEQFGVTSLPMSILVNPKGKIVARDIPLDSVPARVERGIKEDKEKEKKITK